MDDDYTNIGPGEYGDYIRGIAASLSEAAGSDDEYRTKALEAQMKSAQAARENAMKIAQLQASTSRYGIDAQSATAMRALKENARQFDAQHGLEIAEAYTKFSSTPDLMFARNDLVSALGRVGQGLHPAPISSQGQPHAKTWEDFDALTQYRGQSANTFAGGGSGGGGSGQSAASAGSGGGGEAKDPRLSAAGAIMKALPPSESPGADGQDWAALNAIRQMYEAGRPGSLERLGPARQKIAQAGLARLGYDPAAVTEEYYRTRPGQSSPLRAA